MRLMSIYSDKLAHIQAIINYLILLHQGAHKDTLAQVLGSQVVPGFLDDVMSYKSLTTIFLFVFRYGAMHPEIAQCLRMLARLNYIMGEHSEALAYQQKAVLMSERVNGIDHPYTITEYTHLALYCFANSQIRYNFFCFWAQSLVLNYCCVKLPIVQNSIYKQAVLPDLGICIQYYYFSPL